MIVARHLRGDPGIIVFGAMALRDVQVPASPGRGLAAQFTHNTKAEIVWTTIPVLILIGTGVAGDPQPDHVFTTPAMPR